MSTTVVIIRKSNIRAFEYIPYVANPIDIDQQYMNIYVPEGILQQWYCKCGLQYANSPIFVPNAVGGYNAKPKL